MGDSINIRDVAREARVGLGTVSRVLNNHPSVSEETRQRVQEAIRLLHYRPSAQARRLVKGSTDTICFILSNREFLKTFHARILQGVQSFISTTDYQIIYIPISYQPQIPPSAITLPRIITYRDAVDGVIVAGTNYPNFLAALEEIRVPYVVFGNNMIGDVPDRRVDAVSFDEEGGAYEATKHLVDLGHRDIWFLGNTALPWFRDRFNGYLRAVSDHDLRGRWITESDTKDNVQFGSLAISQAIERDPEVTAVVTGNDHVAYGVWKGLRELGVAMPDDISVVGFDDTELCYLTDPPLTSVSVHNEEVGAECARMLLDKLHDPGKRFRERVLSTELIPRGSTGPVCTARAAAGA